MRASSIARTLAASLVLSALGAGAASAHVEPSPEKVKTGSTATITFMVEHGCNGSPTVKLAMRLPAGVSAPVPVAAKGWTTAVSADKTQVTWTGGSIPAKSHGKFTVKLTFDAKSGSVLKLPVVQTCKVGVNRWVDLTEDGDYPAPTITVI